MPSEKVKAFRNAKFQESRGEAYANWTGKGGGKTKTSWGNGRGGSLHTKTQPCVCVEMIPQNC